MLLRDEQKEDENLLMGVNLLLRMLQEGHEIANHGNKDHKAVFLKEKDFYNSLNDCDIILKRVWNRYKREIQERDVHVSNNSPDPNNSPDLFNTTSHISNDDIFT